MGAHILHDSRMKDANNPCGLCLNLGSLCAIRLVRRGKSGDQIDMVNSRCPNLYKISLKHAAKFSKTSPCTNTPIRCPLCPKVSDAIWKYNICSHIANVHRGDISLYQDLYTISNEESVLMKAAFLSKPRKTKRKKTTQNLLKISESHSTRVTLSTILPIDEEDEDQYSSNRGDYRSPEESDTEGSSENDGASIRRSLTPASSEQDPTASTHRSPTPVSFFAVSPVCSLPHCSTSELETGAAAENENSYYEGASSRPIRATRTKAGSISCDGPGCDQRVCAS